MSDRQKAEIDQIELTERQRKRFNRIKRQCTDGGRLPEPSDQAIVDGLLDTWDAVKDGHYSGIQE